MDLMLPGTDGVELMEEIHRLAADLPVIFLSAYGQEQYLGGAFEMGAADYIVKPFSPIELTTRIEAALHNLADQGAAEPSEPYVNGDLTVDYASRNVTIADRPVDLTALEYRLLIELSVNAGKALTYDHLLQRVWGCRKGGDLRPMRTVVKNLRNKLGDDANNPGYILTENRVGYRMPNGQDA